MTLGDVRRRLHSQLDPKARSERGLSPLNWLLAGAILLATASAILQTEPTPSTDVREMLRMIEMGLGALFVFEYVARVWTIPERNAGESASRQRLRHMIGAAAILDLVAIAVTLLPFMTINVLTLRLVRLLGIVRLAKLGSLSTALGLMYEVVRSRKSELLVTLALATVVLIIGASALYWIEGELQPDKFGSIPRALWWAVITLTTIGYGDAYPITPPGKIVAAVVAVAGIGLIAMPTGILASGFSDAFRSRRPILPGPPGA